MRLQNAVAVMHSPLVDPPGSNLLANPPVSKQDLLSMNSTCFFDTSGNLIVFIAAKCQAMALALHLPQLAPAALFAARQQQIIDSLGAALTAQISVRNSV